MLRVGRIIFRVRIVYRELLQGTYMDVWRVWRAVMWPLVDLLKIV